MSDIRRAPGSHRDPKGHVYLRGDRVFRTITAAGREPFEYVKSSGLYDRLQEEGLLVSLRELPKSEWEETGVADGVSTNPEFVLEHSLIPFITYPYEWPFAALKAAALHHLKVQLHALDHSVMLSDATAYNVQFIGSKPVFIDHLSFQPYIEGAFWLGHRQFCEQFLYPLLLRAYRGIPHNSLFRGELDGISADVMRRLLPLNRRFSPRVLMHISLPARFHSTLSDDSSVKLLGQAEATLSKKAFQRMLEKLQAWIEGLRPAEAGSTWGDYAENNSYSEEAAQEKHAFVSKYVEIQRPQLFFDFGCNTGDYTLTALKAGAGRSIGFDLDHVALDRGYLRSAEKALDFLPLYQDAANPSPNQGWAEGERPGFLERARGDGLLALAFVHHLIIGRNIPMADVATWLTRIAPSGVIEFVGKEDAMVKRMLMLREDIFEEYSEDTFTSELSKHTKIIEIFPIPGTHRTLFHYATG